ncbi:unnamed protein product [Urochloa humidicola]
MSPCSCGENDDEVGILGGRRARSRGARGRSCHASSAGARHAGHASPPELAVPGKKRCDTSSSSAVRPRSRGRRSTRPTDLVERGWRSSSRGGAQRSRRRARGRWISSSAVGGARHAAVRRGAGGGRSGRVGLGRRWDPARPSSAGVRRRRSRPALGAAATWGRARQIEAAARRARSLRRQARQGRSLRPRSARRSLADMFRRRRSARRSSASSCRPAPRGRGAAAWQCSPTATRPAGRGQETVA